MDILKYVFFQHALIGSIFTCIACGIVGSYIVSRRLVFISGGITHASLGGLGLGFYFGINPILSALVFSVASAFGVEWLSKKQGIREDSAIASVWALGMAIGVIFIYLTPGYAQSTTSYLFGNILTITRLDIWSVGLFALLMIVLFSLFFKQILYVAFDREFARTKGLPVVWIEHLMMLSIAITIVLSIRLIGIMMLLSLLTIPQMTANIFSSRFKQIIIFSCVIGILGCFGGLFLSYYLNVPSGAAIIFVQVIIFACCKSGMRLKRKFCAERQ